MEMHAALTRRQEEKHLPPLRVLGAPLGRNMVSCIRCGALIPKRDEALDQGLDGKRCNSDLVAGVGCVARAARCGHGLQASHTRL